MKVCHACKEEIKQDANKCKHCGEIQNTQENRKATRDTFIIKLAIYMFVFMFAIYFILNGFRFDINDFL
tara:strand:- start:229 stop:435 length:207 start_codon:yes stop_codon:yes gene_type:complete